MLCIGIVLLIFSVPFLLGRGSQFIAGYNTSSKEEKSKYNTLKMCRSIGITCIIVSIYCFGYFILDDESLYYPLVILSIVTFIFESIYVSKKCVN
ncbi:MAG: DUF3784 domain-containing protein [Bacilli bacterium]